MILLIRHVQITPAICHLACQNNELISPVLSPPPGQTARDRLPMNEHLNGERAKLTHQPIHVTWNTAARTPGAECSEIRDYKFLS